MNISKTKHYSHRPYVALQLVYKYDHCSQFELKERLLQRSDSLQRPKYKIQIFTPEDNFEILLLGLELLVKLRTSSILIQNDLLKVPVYRKVVDTEPIYPSSVANNSVHRSAHSTTPCYWSITIVVDHISLYTPVSS